MIAEQASFDFLFTCLLFLFVITNDDDVDNSK